MWEFGFMTRNINYWNVKQQTNLFLNGMGFIIFSVKYFIKFVLNK